MDGDAQLYLLLTLTLWPLVLVGCVVAVLRMASRSTPPAKRQASPPATPPSEAQLATLAADQAELFSTLGKLTTTVKRLSSRAGMQDYRERAATVEAPPIGTSKAELLRHYGMSGKVGPAFAQAQLDLERNAGNTH